MKFKYELPWEIKRKEVRDADEERILLNKAVSLLLNETYYGPRPCISTETIRKIKEHLGSLEERFFKITNGLDPFDSLIVQDIKANMKAVKSYLDYTTDFKNKNVSLFLYRVFGQGIYRSVISGVKLENYPHELIHEYKKAMFEPNSRQIDSEAILRAQQEPFITLKRQLVKEINNRKEIVNQFLVNIEFLKSASKKDYFLELSSGDGTACGFWDGMNYYIDISADQVPCFKPKGQDTYVFSKGDLTQTVCHEIMHAAKDQISRNMVPNGLFPDGEDYVAFIHSPGYEGVSLYAEKLIGTQISKNPEKFGLTEKEAKIAELSRLTYIPRKLQQLAYSLYDLERWAYDGKENEKDRLPRYEDFPGYRLAKASGIERFRKDPNNLDEVGLEETLLQLSYLAGQKRIFSIAKDLEKMKIPQDKILSAISTGFWCSGKAQRRFVDLYLERVKGK